MSIQSITGSGSNWPNGDVNVERVGRVQMTGQGGRSVGEQKLPQSRQELRRAEQQGEHIPISEKQLLEAIDRALRTMQGPTTQLDFSIHEKTKQIMVKVKNSETGEVIRELPPEKTLDMLANLWKMAGILIDEKR